MPRSVPLAMCAGRLLQQMNRGHVQEPQRSTEFEQRLSEIEAHQQEKRQGWWRDMLQALPAEVKEGVTQSTFD